MKTVATYLQRKLIDEILSKRLHAIEGTSLFRYEEGWDDERVAKEINPQLTSSATTYVRNAVYGKLQKTRRVQVGTVTKVRVERLEYQLVLLLDWMQAYGGVPQA